MLWFSKYFLNRKQYIVELLYDKEYAKRNFPTKIKPIQLSNELLEFYKLNYNKKNQPFTNKMINE